MQENDQVTAVVEATTKSVSVNEVLKNALDWKQWMADDLRLLIKTAKEENTSETSMLNLINHHLKTYSLLNSVFGLVTGAPDDQLFDLPELELLQQAVPGLLADSQNDQSETDIEPMLELTLNELSGNLNELTQKTKQEKVVVDKESVQETDVELDEQTAIDKFEEIVENDLPIVDIQEEENVEKIVVSEDDSNVISNNTDNQVIEDDLKTAQNEPVEIEEQKVLSEEPVFEHHLVIDEANELSPAKGEESDVTSILAAGSGEIPVYEKAEDISTTDLMDKIWESAFDFGLDNENGVA